MTLCTLWFNFLLPTGNPSAWKVFTLAQTRLGGSHCPPTGYRPAGTFSPQGRRRMRHTVLLVPFHVKRDFRMLGQPDWVPLLARPAVLDARLRRETRRLGQYPRVQLAMPVSLSPSPRYSGERAVVRGLISPLGGQWLLPSRAFLPPCMDHISMWSISVAAPHPSCGHLLPTGAKENSPPRFVRTVSRETRFQDVGAARLGATAGSPSSA